MSVVDALRAEGRIDCEHAGYAVPGHPGVLTCRCLICARCAKHTGNSTQGHYWSWCKVTGHTREPHFCCPDNCELEATE